MTRPRPRSRRLRPDAMIRLSAIAVISLSTIGATAKDASDQPVLGGLLVAPTRLVFEGRVRAAELGLVNRGPERATYRIALVPMRMTEDGKIVCVEGTPEPNELLAQGLIRFSPRQVTLEPDEIQTVRLQLRKPADLPAGEYRIHMVLREVPVTPDAMPSKPDSSSGMSVSLIPIYGVSVPIIVRHGDTSATARISNLRFVAEQGERGPRLDFTLEREGNASIYGDLRATTLNVDGKSQILGLQKGLAVYVPNGRRHVEMPLQVAPEVARSARSIHLAFLGSDGQPLATSDWPPR